MREVFCAFIFYLLAVPSVFGQCSTAPTGDAGDCTIHYRADNEAGGQSTAQVAVNLLVEVFAGVGVRPYHKLSRRVL